MAPDFEQPSQSDIDGVQHAKAMLRHAYSSIPGVLPCSLGLDGSLDDIDALGYLYYEGIADLIDADVLSSGAHAVVGDVLVQMCGCHWIKQRTTNRMLLAHSLLTTPIDLWAIEDASRVNKTSPESRSPHPGEWIVASFEYWRDEINYKKIFGQNSVRGFPSL